MNDGAFNKYSINKGINYGFIFRHFINGLPDGSQGKEHP
jgi:hypothetical protein